MDPGDFSFQDAQLKRMISQVGHSFGGHAIESLTLKCVCKWPKKIEP